MDHFAAGRFENVLLINLGALATPEPTETAVGLPLVNLELHLRATGETGYRSVVYQPLTTTGKIGLGDIPLDDVTRLERVPEQRSPAFDRMAVFAGEGMAVRLLDSGESSTVHQHVLYFRAQAPTGFANRNVTQIQCLLATRWEKIPKRALVIIYYIAEDGEIHQSDWELAVRNARQHGFYIVRYSITRTNGHTHNETYARRRRDIVNRFPLSQLEERIARLNVISVTANFTTCLLTYLDLRQYLLSSGPDRRLTVDCLNDRVPEFTE